MNKHNLISVYISENPNTWRKDLENLGIKIKENEHFIIFNYSVGCDFSNDLVKASRGLVLDKSTFDVVCWKFDKFFNSHEQYADNIDWSTAKVQEKVDGSVLGLYWNKYENDWNWSTNGTINAKDAPSESPFSDSFYDIIQKADNLKDINFNELNKQYTYIFELVGKENRVVVEYPTTSLYHIGTRDNLTGKELDIDIGIKKPKSFPLHNFNACVTAIKELSKDIDLKVGSEGLLEGFVVVDSNWHRVKIKTPEYLQLHHFANGVIYNKSKILDILRTDDVNIDEIIKSYPDYKKVFDFYNSEISRVEQEVDVFIDFVRNRYEENGNDRKEIAQEIIGNKYANLGFKALGNNKSSKQLLSELLDVQYERLINDFKEPEPVKDPGGDLF